MVAGDGPQRSELQDLASSLQLDNVEFVGHRWDQAERDSADCAVAVHGAAVSCLRDAGQDDSGILCGGAGRRGVGSGVAAGVGARGRDRNSLSQRGCGSNSRQRSRRWGRSPELARRMGRAGWEFVRQRHAPEAHYRKMLGLYEDLVAAKARKR